MVVVLAISLLNNSTTLTGFFEECQDAEAETDHEEGDGADNADHPGMPGTFHPIPLLW